MRRHMLFKRALPPFALACCLSLVLSPPSSGQIVLPGGGSGGGGGVGVSGTPAAPQGAQWVNSTTLKGVAQGKFNVRTMYGAVPDGSTDNSTAIASAFTASNAFASGVPTVYFDCDASTTTCQYNYGGSGLSPLNPTIATTIECAPGVTLNYTGSAHAVDVGPTGLSQVNTDRFTIQGCRFTGGASYTAGIYVNTYIANLLVTRNEFWNFGSQSAYSIVFNGQDWTPVVEGNYWRDTDGVTRSMIDAHTAVNTNIDFTNNKNECETSGGTACSISTVGVGLWMFTGWVLNNEIKYHYPAVRASSCGSCGGGAGLWVEHNLFEGNTNGAGPAISYGDPGGTGNVHLGHLTIAGNTFYWPTTGAVNFVGPETPATGSYYLDHATIENNYFENAPTGSNPYVNTNGGAGEVYVFNNWSNSGLLTLSSSPPFMDSYGGKNSWWGAAALQGNNGSSLSGAVVMFDSTGVLLEPAGFHGVSSTFACADSSGSGTTQSCNTAPSVGVTGTIFAAAAGDMLIYKTTTTNTGDLTININAQGAIHVRKAGGTAVLGAGDIQAGILHPADL